MPTRSPKLGKRRRVYRNKYHSIYRVRADFGEFSKVFYVSDYGYRVGLVISRGDDVLLVSQYRLLIDSESWEVPGGRVDEDELPNDAAIREAVEEAGLVCRDLQPLLYLHPGLDTFHNPTYVFYTKNFRNAPAGSVHSGEVTGCRWFPLEKCVEMIFEGVIKDSLSITSLLAFLVWKNRKTATRRNVRKSKA